MQGRNDQFGHGQELSQTGENVDTYYLAPYTIWIQHQIYSIEHSTQHSTLRWRRRIWSTAYFWSSSAIRGESRWPITEQLKELYEAHHFLTFVSKKYKVPSLNEADSTLFYFRKRFQTQQMI